MWNWCLKRVEPEKQDQFIIEMERPIRGEVGQPTPREVEMEQEEFAAFYAQVTT